MLTPEDFERIRPAFEVIHQHMENALESDSYDDEACGHYIAALASMEELVGEIAEKDGHGVKESLKQLLDDPAEKAGAAGGLIGAVASLSFTGLGGFGLAGGGTAIGLSGLTGATVATGGTALAGAAALYLAYKGGAVALETDIGKKVADQATEAVKSVSQKAGEALRKIRKS